MMENGIARFYPPYAQPSDARLRATYRDAAHRCDPTHRPLSPSLGHVQWEALNWALR
jgi:hypothetical protein